MAQNFTEFQLQAIAEDAQDICVAAGAGSGKTGVLVERFVRILTRSKSGELPIARRAGVENILVFTFTEKATKEMKQRIVRELNRLGMTDERRQIETAYISTIHGFCSRLLQENPFEAGVDPQFRVLDSPQAARLLRRAFEDSIARAYAEADAEIIELVAQTQHVRPFGTDSDPLTGLAQATEKILYKLRGAGRTIEEARSHWQSGEAEIAVCAEGPLREFLRPILADISACIAAFDALRVGIGGTLEAACRAVLDRAAHLVPDAPDLPQTVLALEETFKSLRNARPRAANATEREWELDALFQRIKTQCEAARELFGMEAEREAFSAQTCRRMWGLVVKLWENYDAAKRRIGQLDSDDLQERAVRLLEEAPNVRLRYRRRFTHLMVDEFQDTNALQMRLIRLLHSSKKDEAAPNQLFIVGDAQQSIYGFRNADSTLFRNLERRFREKGAGLHVPLTVNFRSRPEILETVAQVFRQIWRDSATPFAPLTQGAPFDPKPTPSLEILLSQDITRRDYARFEADALAARIQKMVEGRELTLTSHFDARRGEPVAYRDIAILLRALTDVPRYEEAFARRGVPCFVVGGGRGYYARHEIRDLLNVLTTLDTPLDDVAFAATLRSPFVGADTDTLYRTARYAQQDSGANPTPDTRHPISLYIAAKALLERNEIPEPEAAKLSAFLDALEPLRAQEDRMPVGHLLERLIARTCYDARLLCRSGGRRRLANVRKLLQMANSDSVMGVRDFIRRLRDMEKLSDREGDAPTEEEAADVVRFLTIHSAKGLEFPVVILADLSRGLIMPERGAFVCSPNHLALGTNLSGTPNVIYKAIDTLRVKADKAEYERLLYVAMTRAREHLILCGNMGRNYGVNWADSLFRLLALLDVPTEPTDCLLAGGLTARIAPMSHYVHAPADSNPDVPAPGRRQIAERAERLAASLLAATEA